MALMLLTGIRTVTADDAVRIDLQMENVFFRRGSNMVHAFVYKPQGKGPFPAIVYNQATRDPFFLPNGVYPFEALAKWATSHEYVLFIPDRPGHQADPTKLGDFAELLGDTSNLSQTNRMLLSGFDEIGKDIVAGVNWLTNQSYVDTNKLAMIGHSTGAMQSLLLATKKTPARGFVLFSPAAKLWPENEMIRSLLLAAAKRAKDPILLIQAQNDFTLRPLEELGAELKDRPAPTGTKVYPPYGPNPNQAVLFGVHGTAVWGDDVAAFLTSVWQ